MESRGGSVNPPQVALGVRIPLLSCARPSHGLAPHAVLAAVVQSAEALVSEARGCGFESRQPHRPLGARAPSGRVRRCTQGAEGTRLLNEQAAASRAQVQILPPPSLHAQVRVKHMLGANLAGAWLPRLARQEARASKKCLTKREGLCSVFDASGGLQNPPTWESAKVGELGRAVNPLL